MIKVFSLLIVLVSAPVFAEQAMRTKMVEPCSVVESDLEKLREKTSASATSIVEYLHAISSTMGDWATTFDELVRSKQPIDPTGPNVFSLSKTINVQNEAVIQGIMNELNLSLENILQRIKSCQR